jgi:hypothetical protein
VSPIAVVLYEDQRGPEKEFGLHNLVLACVSDELGGDVFALRLQEKLHGRPMKGIGNLLRSCRRDIRRIGPQGQPVLAVIDDDKIRQQLRHEGLSATADSDAVANAIRAPDKCVAPEQLEVVLLKDNTESVILAAKLCDDTLPAVTVEQALQKDLNARDRIFNRLAWAANRAVRDCIRRKMATFDSLVNVLSARVTAVQAQAPS